MSTNNVGFNADSVLGCLDTIETSNGWGVEALQDDTMSGINMYKRGSNVGDVFFTSGITMQDGVTRFYVTMYQCGDGDKDDYEESWEYATFEELCNKLRQEIAEVCDTL